jgi:hypothetical protein
VDMLFYGHFCFEFKFIYKFSILFVYIYNLGSRSTVSSDSWAVIKVY